jgi:hypothetical protein
MRRRSFAAPLPLPVDYESPETRHGTVLYLLKVKVAGALKLAGNNVFSGNLLLTFVEGTGKRGARLICLTSVVAQRPTSRNARTPTSPPYYT